jgi:small subunit ribosomal protein S13
MTQQHRYYTRERRGQNTLSGYLVAKYGLGTRKAEIICREYGYLPTTPLSMISSEKLSSMNRITKENEIVQRELNTISVSNKVKLGTTQGIRRRRGLPVRGQRTHTNASTSRKLNKGRVFDRH